MLVGGGGRGGGGGGGGVGIKPTRKQQFNYRPVLF